MAWKNESNLNLLLQVPWWGRVVLSGALYLFLKFILLCMDFGNSLANAFAKSLSVAAPLVALVLLVPAPFSAFNSWQKRRLLNGQKGIDSIKALGWREF